MLAVTASVVAVGALVFGFVIKPEMERKNAYEAAVTMLENSEYDDASAAFTELGSYKDSEKMLLRVDADKLYASGDLAGAYKIYKDLDTEYQIHEEDYKKVYSDAEIALSEGNYTDAVTLFESIYSYSDSADQVDAVYYAERRMVLQALVHIEQLMIIKRQME